MTTGQASPAEIARGPFAMLDVMKATMAENAKRDPTDDEILRMISGRGGTMTYVVRNMFNMAGFRRETPWFLRRLKRLEREGRVVRVRTSYATQICWRAILTGDEA